MGFMYVVLVEDRHIDTKPYVFEAERRDAALDFARTEAKELAGDNDEGFPQDETEESRGAYELLLRCSDEGDYVSVEEVQVNPDLDPVTGGPQ